MSNKFSDILRHNRFWNDDEHKHIPDVFQSSKPRPSNRERHIPVRDASAGDYHPEELSPYMIEEKYLADDMMPDAEESTSAFERIHYSQLDRPYEETSHSHDILRPSALVSSSKNFISSAGGKLSAAAVAAATTVGAATAYVSGKISAFWRDPAPVRYSLRTGANIGTLRNLSIPTQLAAPGIALATLVAVAILNPLDPGVRPTGPVAGGGLGGDFQALIDDARDDEEVIAITDGNGNVLTSTDTDHIAQPSSSPQKQQHTTSADKAGSATPPTAGASSSPPANSTDGAAPTPTAGSQPSPAPSQIAPTSPLPVGGYGGGDESGGGLLPTEPAPILPAPQPAPSPSPVPVVPVEPTPLPDPEPVLPDDSITDPVTEPVEDTLEKPLDTDTLNEPTGTVEETKDSLPLGL